MKIKHVSLSACFCVTLAAAMLLLSIPQAAAATSAVPEPGQPFIDATGTAVPTGLNAGRIVSLAPNLTEMLFADGLGDRLAGRTDFCNYPPEVLELPTVGGFVDTSLEQIIALRPDLVLAAQGNSLELVEQLRKAGITVLAFYEPTRLADVRDQLLTLWRVAGDGSAPYPLEQRAFDAKYTAIGAIAANGAGTADSSGATKPVVFFGYPGENTLTCGTGSFLDDLISLSGGVNAAHEVEGRWPVVSPEFLVAVDPDWILTATPCSGSDDLDAARADLLAQLGQDPVWSRLKAVRRGNVLVLDADILLRPGPRLFEALGQLSSALRNSSAGAAGAAD